MQTTQRRNKLWVAVGSKTSMQHCTFKGKRFITCCCLSVFKTRSHYVYSSGCPQIYQAGRPGCPEAQRFSTSLVLEVKVYLSLCWLYSQTSRQQAHNCVLHCSVIVMMALLWQDIHKTFLPPVYSCYRNGDANNAQTAPHANPLPTLKSNCSVIVNPSDCNIWMHL